MTSSELSNYKITTRRVDKERFKVTIFDSEKTNELGNFETTDANLINDICLFYFKFISK